MRSQDRSRRLKGALAGTIAIAVAGAVAAQSVPELYGPVDPMEPIPADPIHRWVTDDRRVMRAYPEQPPVIPHSIEGYQLTVNANRCLSCHRRETTESSGAPMISVTHYMTREGQMLADVSSRRYFCTQCHVPQSDAQPLVGNTFTDMTELGPAPEGE